MLKFRTGDKVIVKSGKDKGREGTIAKIYPKEELVVIAGVNLYKKHVKKQMAADGKGGVYELPRPLHWSKVAHVDPKTGKATRIGFEVKNGKKVRLSKKSSIDIDAPAVAKAVAGKVGKKKTNKK
jgi:large subunit ribosomal protein L24